MVEFNEVVRVDDRFNNTLAGIIIQRLENMGGWCPEQYEGYTVDDRPIYIRFRSFSLSVHLGHVGQRHREWDLEEQVFAASIAPRDPNEESDGGCVGLEIILQVTGLKLSDNFTWYCSV